VNRAVIAGAVVAALVAAGVGVKVLLTTSKPPIAPGCVVSFSSMTWSLDLDQAANATTIAAVGKNLGLPDHAVTVALAVALQESGLHNLAYGDRDSRGLFQQRPSQGWGTAQQVMTPRYSAAAFFQHLANVSGWQTQPVTVAAQKVQRSGTPGAYAQWESEARALAQAMTGEVPAALSCHLPNQPTNPGTASLSSTMALELGGATLGVALDTARGWTVASWLVGHATQYGITSVGFNGQVWTPTGGSWQASGVADPQVRVVQAKPV
jgi:hypothetical protein